MTRLDRFARIEAQDRAERIAFRDLVGFVRDAQAQGWDPVSFVPPAAWRLRQAVAQAVVWEELEREGANGGMDASIQGTQVP